MDNLTLYFKPTCPFCGKVLTFMEENHITVPLKDVNANSENRKELMDIGGKTQVPCLVIDGKPLYESDDIIQWMKDHLEDLLK